MCGQGQCGHQWIGLGRLLVQLILAVHLTRDLLDVDLGCFLFVDP